MTIVRNTVPWGAAALVVAGVAFALFPILRPWHDEATLAGATMAFGSAAWVLSHYAGVMAFILVPFGLLALRKHLKGGPGESAALAALLGTWLGVGLILPYFGAETFGLQAVARSAAQGQVADLLGITEAVRLGPVAAVTFALGLLLIAAGGVLTAVAVQRSRTLPAGSGVLFAAGMLLYLPQFFGSPTLRIAHGILLALGCLWLALVLWRSADPGR